MGFGRIRRNQPSAKTQAVLTFAVATGMLVGCGGADEAPSKAPSMLGDASGKAASGSFSGSNSAPEVESVELTPSRPSPGRTVVARARVFDEDGDRTTIAYRWVSSDGTLLGEGARFDTAGLSPGERISVEVVASDGQEESDAFEESLRIAEEASQVAIVAIDTEEGTHAGATLKAYFESTGEGFSDFGVEYQWEVNGEVVSTDDELETSAFAPGDRVTLGARMEGDGSRFIQSQPVLLTRGDAPQITSQPMAGIEGGVFRYQISADSAAPDAELHFELLKGPEGMSVGRESGLVEWRPDRSQRGRFEIEVAVKDQWGSGVAQSFAIEAAGAAAPPASRR